MTRHQVTFVYHSNFVKLGQLEHTSPMSTVYLAALSAIITTVITTATSSHLPQLLHPLFGSIPSSLCQPHAERASFVAACIILRAALAGRSNADVQYSIINPLVAFSSSLYAVPLMIRPLAVLGGDNLGPTWGPLLPLLILGTLVNIAGLWLVLVSVVCHRSIQANYRFFGLITSLLQ